MELWDLRWKTQVLLDEMRQSLGRSVEILEDCFQLGACSEDIPFADLASHYAKLPKISIDNAVLELSKKVGLVRGDFSWCDVGSWNALSQCFETDEENNFQKGDVLMIDTQNSVIDAKGLFTACIGLDNVVVVSSQDAVLVCAKDRAQDVKKVVNYLKDHSRSSLL